MPNSSLQKETARLLEQPGRECKTLKAQFSKELQMNHSTSPCCRPNQPTMSSLEIADLTGKNHRDVLRNVRKTLEQAGIEVAQFCATYQHPQNKQPYTAYNLPRAECDLVVSGYSVKYRWAIIQRWHELERKVGTGETAPQTALTPDEYRELLEKRGKIIVDRETTAPAPTFEALAEERLRFSCFIMRFDPISGRVQLSEVSKNACIIDPDNPSRLETFINEFVRFEQIPVVLQAAMNRVNLCYQEVKSKAALSAPTATPQGRPAPVGQAESS